MVVPYRASGSPSEFDSLKSYVKRHQLLIAIMLVAGLLVTPTIIYYEMSYNSVNGTTVQIASARRNVSGGCGSSWPFCNGQTSIYSVTYSIEAHVWSYATSLDTRVNDPTFSLVVDNNPISSQQGGSGTFKPYSYIIYYLTFTTTNSAVANSVGSRTSNFVSLAMDASMSAGMYSGYVTVENSLTYTF